MPSVNENFYETYTLPVELSSKSFVEIIIEQGNLDKMMITEKVFKAFSDQKYFSSLQYSWVYKILKRAWL